VIAALLDGAMTNCLFAQGQAAYTGDLRVRFLHPVAAVRTVTLRARVRRSRSYWHEVEAELEQDGVPKARATAWFINQRTGGSCSHEAQKP
jgi:acyl-coenzyme A thioesterase PaaI-like protein